MVYYTAYDERATYPLGGGYLSEDLPSYNDGEKVTDAVISADAVIGEYQIIGVFRPPVQLLFEVSDSYYTKCTDQSERNVLNLRQNAKFGVLTVNFAQEKGLDYLS